MQNVIVNTRENETEREREREREREAEGYAPGKVIDHNDHHNIPEEHPATRYLAAVFVTLGLLRVYMRHLDPAFSGDGDVHPAEHQA